MTDYTPIIAEWFEEIIQVPLAPEPIVPEPKIERKMPEHVMHFSPAKVKRVGFNRPPMQFTVTDKKRKGYDADVFNRLDNVLDIVGHDLDNPMQNSKPSYNFGGHRHDKRVKCSWSKLDKYYASLEGENE